MINVDAKHGRIKILTSRELTGNIDKDEETIPLILAESITLHHLNVSQMSKFIDIYYNIMDIRFKETTARPDINNKISIPNAKTTVDTINSYCFSNNPKCISREAEGNVEIKDFNDCLNYDLSYDKLRKIAFYSGICGLGYRLVMKPNQSDIEKGKFIKSVGDIDPKDAFCVYSNDIERKKVLGVIYYTTKKKIKSDGKYKTVTVKIFNVFTRWHQWTFELIGTSYAVQKFYITVADTDLELMCNPYSFTEAKGVVTAKEKNIPLIEYERHPARINDFEEGISIMNAINRIISDSTDAISQNVDYVFKMKNIDMGTFVTETDADGNEYEINHTLENTKKWMAEHILAYNGVEGSSVQPDIDILEVPLDQSEVQSLVSFLKSELQTHTFIPNRNSGTGQDTGEAVINRNGFRSLEDIAGIVTNSMLISEKEFFEIAIDFAKDIKDCPINKLSIKNINIDPMRNKIVNLGEAVNSYVALIKVNTPAEIALQITGLVPDYIDTGKTIEAYTATKVKETLANAKALAEAESTKEDDDNSSNAVKVADEPKTE